MEKGIVTAYEHLDNIMRQPSPMSRWSEIKSAMRTLGVAIYGRRK